MIKRSKSNRGNFSSKSGFTLVEVMVASVILTITGLGVLTGFLQARRMTEGSIYVATATTIAQGYIEQLKSMEFSLLDEGTLTELTSEGSADSLVVSPIVADPEVGNASSDIPNIRSIDINNTPEDEGDDLAINFVVYVENITDAATRVSDARRVILRWSYEDTTTGSSVHVGNTLYSIRSRVPTF